VPSLATNVGLFSKLSYDPRKDLQAVTQLIVAPALVVVPNGSPYKTFAQLVQGAKSSPKGLTYASQGVGTGAHLFGTLLSDHLGVKMSHAPYRGSIPGLTDVMGGQLDSSFATLGSVLPQVQAGKLTALAVASPRRSALLPNVPTFAEAGVKGYAADAWYGLLAPAGTPANVLQALEKVAGQFTEQPATVAKLQGLGMEPQHSCRDAFGADMDRDAKAYIKLARELDLKAE